MVFPNLLLLPPRLFQIDSGQPEVKVIQARLLQRIIDWRIQADIW